MLTVGHFMFGNVRWCINETFFVKLKIVHNLYDIYYRFLQSAFYLANNIEIGKRNKEVKLQA